MYKGFGRPRVLHALIVIFGEFFAWGLLTTPTITALKQTFPGQTLMINGLIWGIKVGIAEREHRLNHSMPSDTNCSRVIYSFRGSCHS